MVAQRPDRLTRDAVYDLLSNPRRRFAISYLNRRDSPVGLNELAKQAAAWENNTTVGNVTDQQRKRAYVSMHQIHVPKLAEAGIIERGDAGELYLAESAAQIDRYLPGSRSRDRRWAKRYLLVAIGGGLAYGLVRWFVPSDLGSIAVSFAVVSAFLALAVFHQRRTMPMTELFVGTLRWE